MIYKYWYSYFISRCFRCKETKNKPIYLFIGCGKYHDTLLCHNCYLKKLKEKNNVSYLPTPINPDPLGSSIIIYHPFKYFLWDVHL